MQTVKINGKSVSKIAFGSTDFGGRLSERTAFELLDYYASIGGNYIDTAHVYGDFITPKNGESEKVIGRWIKLNNNREHIFLSTKGAHHVLGAKPVGRLKRDEILSDIRESLDALQVENADIYWLHRDNLDFSVGEVMETLQELVELGYTKLIGASNWSVRRITEANEYAAAHSLTPFFANQPQLSLPIQTKPDDYSLVQADAEMIEMHRKSGMLMTPYSSQAKGFLSKLDKLGANGLDDKTARRFMTDDNLGIYSRCKQVSLETGLSVGAIGLLWLCAQDFPVIPIVGASKLSQLEQVKEAADKTISAKQRDFIRKI